MDSEIKRIIVDLNLIMTNKDMQGYGKSLTMAQKYLEKEIRQKVIKTDTSSQACPACKSNVNWTYCSNCGQKLSYS